MCTVDVISFGNKKCHLCDLCSWKRKKIYASTMIFLWFLVYTSAHSFYTSFLLVCPLSLIIHNLINLFFRRYSTLSKSARTSTLTRESKKFNSLRRDGKMPQYMMWVFFQIYSARCELHTMWPHGDKSTVIHNVMGPWLQWLPLLL